MTLRGVSVAGLGLLAGAVALMAAGGVSAAEPQPWQLGLQAPAGSIAEKANSLHNLLLVIITAISLFVLALLVYTCVRFRQSANPTLGIITPAMIRAADRIAFDLLAVTHDHC